MSHAVAQKVRKTFYLDAKLVKDLQDLVEDRKQSSYVEEIIRGYITMQKRRKVFEKIEKWRKTADVHNFGTREETIAMIRDFRDNR